MKLLCFIVILLTANIGAFARKIGPFMLNENYNEQYTTDPIIDTVIEPSTVLCEENTTCSSSYVKKVNEYFELVHERIYYILI